MTVAAGVVLAGGRSSRMGAAKATLDWHGTTLLRRAVGIVGRAVDGPVVVVGAAGQELPALPAGVELTRDARDGRGPLQGIAAGLAAIGDRAATVFVTGVDAPLLHPAFVRCVLCSLREDDDVALPHAHGFRHPLAAAYRTSVAAPLRRLLLEERLGTAELMRRCRVRELDEHMLLADVALRVLDPQLRSLLNINERAEYEAALARPAPAVTVRCFGRLRLGGDPIALRAATLAAAAAGAGVSLQRDVVALLNGHAVIDDPQEPLVTGDTVALFAAESGQPPRAA